MYACICSLNSHVIITFLCLLVSIILNSINNTLNLNNIFSLIYVLKTKREYNYTNSNLIFYCY